MKPKQKPVCRRVIHDLAYFTRKQSATKQYFRWRQQHAFDKTLMLVHSYRFERQKNP
jgi:hypothetical protein